MSGGLEDFGVSTDTEEADDDTVRVTATDDADGMQIDVDGRTHTLAPGSDHYLPPERAEALAADGLVEYTHADDAPDASDDRDVTPGRDWALSLPMPGDVMDIAIARGEFPDADSSPTPPDLDRLKASKLAYYLEQALREADCMDWIATEGDETLYFYDGDAGIWDASIAHSRLRRVARDCLADAYSDRALAELESRIKAEQIGRDTLGTPDRTIAVANGLLDLETRELTDLRREHYAIARLPVAYDADATCPRFEQFIDEVVEDGMADAIQEYIGYTLLKDELPIHRALMLVGSGSNGKSTLLNLVVDLLGADNVTGFDLGDLVHNEYYAAELYGAFANIDTDVTGGIGKGGQFKKLVGGDAKVGAREIYGQPFDFKPTSKLLFSANEVPDTDVDDDAFFRRWLIVEFPNEFTPPDEPGPDIDPTLEGALRDELSGILNWALDGLDRLLEQDHFTNEGSVADRRDRWQLWGDSLDRFVTEHVTGTDDPDDKIRAETLHRRYVAYCREVLNESPQSQTQLTTTIKAAGEGRYGRPRFDGRQERGFTHLTCSYIPDDPQGDPGDGDDSGGDERSGRLDDFEEGSDGGDERGDGDDSQGALHDAIMAGFGEDGGPVMRESLEAYAREQGFDDDRVTHHIGELLEAGRLIENGDGEIIRG